MLKYNWQITQYKEENGIVVLYTATPAQDENGATQIEITYKKDYEKYLCEYHIKVINSSFDYEDGFLFAISKDDYFKLIKGIEELNSLNYLKSFILTGNQKNKYVNQELGFLNPEEIERLQKGLL